METQLQKFSPGYVRDVLDRLKQKKIVVAGDLMVDVYLSGSVSRISPEAPVPIIDIKDETARFGGAANVALNLKMLGCEPLLVGLIGNDRMGTVLLDLMRQHHLDTSGIVQSDDRPTTVKTRIIGDNQHIARVDREVATYISGGLEQKVGELLTRMIHEAHGIVLEDYNKGLLTKKVIRTAIESARQKNIYSGVDPKFVHFMEFGQATVFKPNILEVSKALARLLDTEEQITTAGQELVKRLQVESVLLTRGARGMTLFEDSGNVTHIPTRARNIADVSGAGDTVISTMLAALTTGIPKPDAAYLANVAAGLVCEEVGIVPITREKLLQAFTED